jgi:2,4'-dihydroxyacetophenone dioxygenase
MTKPSSAYQQERLLSININEEPYFPGAAEGSEIIPLFLDRENGVWVLYGRFAPGTLVPTHFHTGVVHFFTTKGRWHYLEHQESPQIAGSYLYETGASIHTFAVPADATEPAEGFMVVLGANVNFVGDEYQSVRDAGAIEDGVLAAAEKAGLPKPRYIRPRGGAEFTRA